ncbi:GMC oxidoreductase [Aquimarina sp. 2201CG14-23]|uniref:GMC oxidoreductase n=1 Tax=Aquimarina mycalae TaxID=3040073 RepID=UPI002477EC7F|nr:GMC oxidoreductase [Aquimarina sp. 2201CG14-23]MDH7444050.1 GMC oxidoreductase [Aquimarina sp. 2201CG14-23]
MKLKEQYDYVIVGSGFGGSVSALRLSEKGYKVLVIEKGKWYTSSDFPKSNWNLKKWLWVPLFRWFGIMKMSFFKHVVVISGTGVGGGSLVYANTLPIPKKEFFTSGSWKNLADWQSELAPFYQIALKMLGAQKNPQLFDGDKALKELASTMNIKDDFSATDVAVFFGTPNKTVPDPYFEGKGPERTGCNFCGGCMTGCRVGAKNTLDKNYLYLAQQLGADILAEHEVFDVMPSSDGYEVKFKSATRIYKSKKSIHTKGIIFSGGVLGTVKLLLKLKQKSLPKLSDRLGSDIRTNNESLISVTNLDGTKDMSKGVAIGSILNTDKNSHLEIVRYAKGSGFWRLSHLPLTHGKNVIVRITKMITSFIKHPISYIKLYTSRDWSKNTAILLFMQTLDSTLKFKINALGLMNTTVAEGKKPSAFIPQSLNLAKSYAKITAGKETVFGLEPLAGIPSTAHILGGAVMGANIAEGVIDQSNKVFGYNNMYICDGSMISANPGVNPSLSITAITEHAMSKIPNKEN